MRTVELARVAVRAEALYVRRRVRRTALRAVWGLFALVFLLGAVIAGHVAGALVLAQSLSPAQAALVVGGIDLAICVICAVLAGRDVPGRVEREALEVREMARKHLLGSIATATLVGPVLRAALREIFGRRR